MASDYDVGDVVRITGTFTSTSGALTNPTKVSIRHQTPETGSVVIRTSTTGGGVGNPSTGKFTSDVLIDSSGVWEYRVSSTGLISASSEGYWRVRSRRIP